MIGAKIRLRCGLVLPNRIVKSALSEGLATDHMLPSAAHERLYERWAKGGVGLVVTGNLMIDRARAVARGDLAIDDRAEGPLRAMANAVTRHGVPFFAQLNHPGRQSPKSVSDETVAPSAIAIQRGGFVFVGPRALTAPEIEALVARFVTAALVAERAGFSGVEIHAAHGYLLSQFLSPEANARRDAWGGDATRRRKLLLDVVRAVRHAVSPHLAVAVKLNSSDFLRGGLEMESSLAIAHALDEEGIDVLEVTGGTYESNAILGRRGALAEVRDAYFAEYVRALRAGPRQLGCVVLLTGGQRRLATMNRLLEEGVHDLVGLGRPLILDPELPRRLLAGADAPPDPRGTILPAALDAATELAWYTAQIERLSRGKDADRTLPRARAVSKVVTSFLR